MALTLTVERRIVSDPRVLRGKPVIKGTRLSVEFVLELLRSGMSFSEILEEYPHLRKADLVAAVSFAKRAVAREEVIHLVPA